MDLSQLRNEIDEIDDELVPLLLKRMDVSRRVAEYKVANNIPVLHEKREQEVLDLVAESAASRAR